MLILTDCNFLRLSLNHFMLDYQSKEKVRGFTLIFDLRKFLFADAVITKIEDIMENANISRVILLSEDNNLIYKGFVININTSLNQAKYDFHLSLKNNFSWNNLKDIIINHFSEYDLSPRLATTRQLIRDGMSVYEISKKMHIKNKTVYSYINTLKVLYNVKNINSLYFYLQKHHYNFGNI